MSSLSSLGDVCFDVISTSIVNKLIENTLNVNEQVSMGSYILLTITAYDC